MKGLLIKDIKLIEKQKYIMILWLGLSLFMMFGNQDPTFALSYGMFLMVILLIGTISYDDFDNGISFIMTLPIKRKTYAIEKYVLTLGGTFLAYVFITLVGCGFLTLHPETLPIKDYLEIGFIIYLVASVLASVMIPIQLKYGAEKGRVVLLVITGLIVCFSFLASKLKQVLAMITDFTAAIASSLGTTAFSILGVLIVCLFICLSVRISIHIMEHEEY